MQTTNNPIPEHPNPGSEPRRRGGRIGAMVGAGLLAGLIAAGIGGVASAQSGGTTVVSQVDNDSQGVSVVLGGSGEDDAIWQQFDQCLTDAGVDFDALDAAEEAGSLTEADEERVDAAFESCEAVLETLSEGELEHWDMELSAEDEAIFDQFDQCLADAGIDVGDDGAEDDQEVFEIEIDEADMDALDAAFDSCEPILDNLSDDVKMAEAFEGGFEDGDFDDWEMELSAEDEAVFDQFDQCLTDAGVDFDALDAAFEDGSVTEADEDVIDAAFEQCDPILENLSDEISTIGELSAEAEGLFEQFDQCLADAGIDIAEHGDAEDGYEMFEIDEADMDTLDAAFDSCEPILESLGDDFMMFAHDIDGEDTGDDEDE